jgi:CBS-domain-containing membrane protein
MQSLALGNIASPTLHIPGADPWYANPGDPALSVMTDFRERASVTVDEAATIDSALEHMKHTGVRCAFAIDESRRVVVGMITAYDIMSEKPVRYAEAVGTNRGDVVVRDIMQKLNEVRVADVKDIERVNVATLFQMFEDTRLTHIPVVETVGAGEQRLRGLLSGAKVKRLLRK